MMTAKTMPTSGPSGYENWKAALRGEPILEEREFQLYSDAHITDEIVPGIGPYTFYNAVPATLIGTFAHALTLRVALHAEETHPDMDRTDVSRYHGGRLEDEISGLVALLLGIRLEPGSITRVFHEREGPTGRPRADMYAPQSPVFPRDRWGWRIPRANGTRSSHDIKKAMLPLFDAYITLSPSQAMALVRAASLYEGAMYLVEASPQIAWLLFVSAVEVVAVEWRGTLETPEDTLRETNPDLCAVLEEAGGATLVSRVALKMQSLLGSTSRFLSFLERFHPAPPERPETEQCFAIDWSWPALRKALAKVYAYRSDVLHNGTPFPSPMCDPPFLGGVLWEKPAGFATAANQGTWVSKDLPMLIHTFEHICRGAILRWWESCLKTETPETSPDGLPGAVTHDMARQSPGREAES